MTTLRQLREALTDMRRALASMEAAGITNRTLVEQTRELARRQVTVQVKCILCKTPSPVIVRVDDTAVPNTLLCGACNAAVTEETLRQEG